MRSNVIAALVTGLAVLLLGTGCVSKKDHEALQAQLDACEAEKAQSEAAVISWEQRFDRESSRWEQMEASVSSALPRALSEFQAERDRIVEMVPEQVQDDITRYLDEYFNTVMVGFERLQEDNQETRIQLLATQKTLEMLGQDTQSIGTAIDQSLNDSREKREQVAQDLADVIDQIVEFDQTRLTCKKCPERLRMRDNTREQMIAFHQELMSDLASLQTFASLPVSALGDPDVAEGDGDEGAADG